MRSFRFRPGLMMWALVWLLVASVPLWRLRAVRQGESPIVDFPSSSQRFGLTSDLEREVARRFPDDAGAQLAPLHWAVSQDINASQHWSGKADIKADRRTLQERAVAYFGFYDELERRFPEAGAVRAQRLREATLGQLIRDEGPRAKGTAQLSSPLAQVAPVWLARPELESSLRTARAGASREPDNGFYPWMQAVLLFSLDRPDDAIKALDAAGRCSMWSDDTNNTIARRLALLRRLQPVRWEDSSREAWQILFPHLAKMRSAARAATGQMRLARQRGDEARALQIAGILQRAGANLARDRDSLIGEMVGRAVCGIARNATIEDLPNPPKRPIFQNQPTAQQEQQAEDDYHQAILKQFAAYMRAHGRADLAIEALRIEPTLDSQQLARVYQSPQFDDFFLRGQILSGAFWLGAMLLRLSAGASLLWLVTWAFTRRRKLQSSGKMLVLSFFGLGATAATLGAMMAFGAGASPELSGTSDPAPPSSLQQTALWMLLSLWLFCIVVASLLDGKRSWKPNLRLRLQNGTPDWRRLVSFALWSFSLSGLVLILSGTPVPDSPFWPAFGVAWMLGLVVDSALLIAWAPPEKRMARIFGAGAFWTGVVALFLGGSAGDGLFYAQFVWGIAFCFAVLALFFGRRERAITQSGVWSWLGDIAARTRVAASVVALGATLSYLVVALWTVPLERHAQTVLEHQLQIGEPAFLREQLARPQSDVK